jgi:hypothetical protein
MQIYNIENAYYNLELTFLNNFTFYSVDFYELGKVCHELHGFPRIIFSATDYKIKRIKKICVNIFNLWLKKIHR